MFSEMLEVADTQNSIGVLADALAIEIDSNRLQANTEIVSEKAVKIGIENATAEEVVAIVNSFLDTASADVELTVVESACGKCAVVILNDNDAQELSELSKKGVVEIAASPIFDDGEDDDDDEEQEDEHLADPDEDSDSEQEEEDEEDANADDDPNQMKIISDEEAFKLASRLHALACGPDKRGFAHFLTSMDKLLYGFRQSSGYEPPANEEEETASVENNLFELAFSLLDASSKKKSKHKEGRYGFLKAYTKILHKRADEIAEAHDALDVETLTHLLAEVGADYMQIVSQERVDRGLDGPDPKDVHDKAEKELEEATTKRFISK